MSAPQLPQLPHQAPQRPYALRAPSASGPTAYARVTADTAAPTTVTGTADGVQAVDSASRLHAQPTPLPVRTRQSGPLETHAPLAPSIAVAAADWGENRCVVPNSVAAWHVIDGLAISQLSGASRLFLSYLFNRTFTVPAPAQRNAAVGTAQQTDHLADVHDRSDASTMTAIGADDEHIGIVFVLEREVATLQYLYPTQHYKVRWSKKQLGRLRQLLVTKGILVYYPDAHRPGEGWLGWSPLFAAGLHTHRPGWGGARVSHRQRAFDALDALDALDCDTPPARTDAAAQTAAATFERAVARPVARPLDGIATNKINGAPDTAACTPTGPSICHHSTCIDTWQVDESDQSGLEPPGYNLDTPQGPAKTQVVATTPPIHQSSSAQVVAGQNSVARTTELPAQTAQKHATDLPTSARAHAHAPTHTRMYGQTDRHNLQINNFLITDSLSVCPSHSDQADGTQRVRAAQEARYEACPPDAVRVQGRSAAPTTPAPAGRPHTTSQHNTLVPSILAAQTTRDADRTAAAHSGAHHTVDRTSARPAPATDARIGPREQQRQLPGTALPPVPAAAPAGRPVAPAAPRQAATQPDGHTLDDVRTILLAAENWTATNADDAMLSALSSKYPIGWLFTEAINYLPAPTHSMKGFVAWCQGATGMRNLQRYRATHLAQDQAAAIPQQLQPASQSTAGPILTAEQRARLRRLTQPS